MSKHILCLDPSFTMTGWAVISVPEMQVVAMGAIPTKRTKEKTASISIDDMERVRTIARALNCIKARFGVDAVAVEVPTGSKSAQAAKGLGIAKALVGSFVEFHELPCRYAMPQTIKKALTGNRNASKGDIEAKASAFFDITAEGTAPAREAQYDALAVAIEAKDSDLFRLLGA